MTDPRERIETGKFLCRMEHSACWSIRPPDPYCGVPFANWPEVVAFAEKILAANESWLDGQTVTLDELLAGYPDWRATCVFVRTGWRVWAERLRAPGHPIGQDKFPTKEAAIRWLAVKLEELTDGK